MKKGEEEGGGERSPPFSLLFPLPAGSRGGEGIPALPWCVTPRLPFPSPCQCDADTVPARRPPPAAAPHCACPPRPSQAQTPTAAPRSPAGCGESAERGRDGTGRDGRRALSPPAPRPQPYSFLFYAFYFPRGLRAGGPGSAHAAQPRAAGARPSPAPPSVPPPPLGGAAASPGEGRRGGSRVQRCARGRQSLGSRGRFPATPAGTAAAARGGGGAPRAGASLAACPTGRAAPRGGVKPHYTGFNVARRPGGTPAPKGSGGRGGGAAVRPKQSPAPGFPPGHRPEGSPRGALPVTPRPLSARCQRGAPGWASPLRSSFGRFAPRVRRAAGRARPVGREVGRAG